MPNDKVESSAEDPRAKWARENPEKVREARQRYRAKNKDLLNARARQWRADNPERVQQQYADSAERRREYQRERYKQNPEKIIARNREYAQRPEIVVRTRERALARKYGMTYAEYHALNVAQEGKCAACGGPPGQIGMVVDHNHTTGAVRGLLCGRCNSALGLLGDSAAKVAQLLDYVRRTDGPAAAE